MSSSNDIHSASLDSSALRVDLHNLTDPGVTATVDEKLYSGFLEHLGRCIYGGILDDPKKPSPKELVVPQDGEGIKQGRLGWRKDVMDVIKADGDLQVPMLRWPGGNFVSNYHWQDGIGPIEKRPKRVELAWLGTESNVFGTVEFIDYCRAAKCEPYICLNMGTGTYEEALAWLEFCNGTGDTHWANLRRQYTGRDEAFGVKYWGLGNECWGFWQVGNMNAIEYSKKAARWAHGLRLVDPNIKLVSCGITGNDDWDRVVLQELVGFVDLHSLHFYTTLGSEAHDNGTSPYEKNVFGPAAAEKGIEVCTSLIDLAKNTPRPQNWNVPTVKTFDRDVKICYDEWNCWSEVKAPGSKGLEQAYDYTDALGVAAWLHVFIRKHKEVAVACIAQSVNVISPLMTSPTGLLYQTTYFPLRAFSRHMRGGKVLDLSYNTAKYTGPTFPEWIQHMATPSYVDCVAMALETDKGKVSVRLSVLNRHPKASWNGKIEFVGFEVTSAKVQELYSDDLEAVNTFECPETVKPVETEIDGKEWEKKADWTFRKHSWTFFVLEGSAK